jgi:hypothetical protein
MSRLQTFLASNVGFFQPQRATAQPAAPTRPLEGFLQQHASFFGADKPQAATYPMDARGNFHAEDPQTRPYQPIPVPEGGRARYFTGKEGQGAWAVLDAAQEKEYKGMEEAQARVDFQKTQVEQLPVPTVTAPINQAIYGINALQARGLSALGLMDKETADNVTRLRGEVAEAARQNDPNKIRGYVRGAIESLTSAAIGGVGGRVLGGLAGLGTKGAGIAAGATNVANLGLQAANEAFVEAIDAGRSREDATKFAVTTGGIEAGITSAFQVAGAYIPGAAGLEGFFNKTAQQLAKESWKKLGTRALIGLAAEETEELMVATADNFNRISQGVNPQEWGPLMQETLLQTAFTMGIGNSMQAVRVGREKWVARNPEAAAKLAAIENPSRKDLADAGISGARNTTPDERAAVASDLRDALKLPNKVTKWAKVDAGDMVSYQGRPWLVENRSDNGNRFTLYDEQGQRAENIDRRELNGYQKLPKQPLGPLPDSQPGEPASRPLTDAWELVSEGRQLPPGAVTFTDPTSGLTYARQGEVPQRPDGVPVEEKPVFEPVDTTTETTNAPQAQVPPPEQAAVESPTTEAVSPELRNHYKEMTGRELGGLVKPKREHIPAIQFFNARKTKVQFFKSPDGSTANSFYDPKTRTVFLNSEKTGDPLWYLVGHEYAHASGADQRLADLPPEVLDEAKRNYAAGAAPAYLKKLQANPRLWEREAVARYVGEVLADPEQRARIRNENPTLWQKIVEAVKRLLGADKVPPSIRKVLDELNTLPPGETPLPVNAAATPQTPQATTTTTANPNDRYADYTGFANPARGTVAGDMQQATAEGMGPTKRDARPRAQRIQDAAAEYSVDPQAVRAELDEAIRSDQPLSDRQSDLLNIVRAEAAQNALTSKATDDLAEVARLNRAYLEKGSEAGKALQARSEAQWQTPEGRAVILAEELTGLTASELDALEKAKADLRRLGGDTGPMLSDSGPMLADVVQDVLDKVQAAKANRDSVFDATRGDTSPAAVQARKDAKAAYDAARIEQAKAKPIIRAGTERTDEEKASVKTALRDDKVARAVQNVIRLERQIAAKQAAFRARMEAKGVIPSTPQGIQAMLNDRYATLYAVRQMRAWKNLGKGFGSSLTGGKVGLGGALDVMYEASMANILSGIRSVVMNAAGTPLNWAGHLIPRAVEATGNAIAKAATGGRKGTTGAQWGEFKYLLQGLVDGAKVGVQYAVESAANEVSVLDDTSGRHGSALEGHGTDYAIPGKLGWLVRLPGYGSNRFFDDLSRTTIAHMEARANAYRDAVEQGLSGQALEQHVDALYNDKQSIAWQGDVRGAYETANKFAFQEKGGATRQKYINNLSRIRKEWHGVRWFLRFVKFPINAAVQTKEWTPFHIAHILDKGSENLRAGREWSYGIKEDMAKAFVGTLALISIMGSLEDDEREEFFGITGSAHPDPAKRNSFRFGDTYVSYRAAEPFGSALSLLADTGLSIKKHGFGVDSTIGSMAALADTVINKPTMRGINDITTYAREYARSRTENDPEILTKATARVLSQQALSFMPRIVSSFTEAAGEGTGYEQRKRAINELFDLNISNIAAQYDAWGNKKEEGLFGHPLGDYAYKLISPMDVVTVPEHPGNALIGRWNATQTDAKKRFKAPELAAEYTRDGETFRMKPEQYQRYAELSGQIAAKLYDAGNFDAENPTQQQINALERNFADARKMAKELLHKEWNGGAKASVDAATVAASIRQAQVRRLQETARSKPTLKVLPGEDVNRAKKRIADWKVNRDEAVAELRRLKVLN